MDSETESQLCLSLLEDAITKGVDGPVAAVMMEPIQGNGGHIEFPRSYYKGVREICDRHGVLMILDEVQTGLGRVGTMWAAEYYGVTPDIIVFGKGVGGGFPLAGILADTRLKWFDEGEEALTFGNSRCRWPPAPPPSRRSRTTACATKPARPANMRRRAY
jgi:acetylornithine/succinyldiaminopimelate/putrescine aminotransferase